jgi:hypothetical protein
VRVLLSDGVYSERQLMAIYGFQVKAWCQEVHLKQNNRHENITKFPQNKFFIYKMFFTLLSIQMKYNLKQTVSLNHIILPKNKALKSNTKTAQKQPWGMVVLKGRLSFMDDILLLAFNKKHFPPLN